MSKPFVIPGRPVTPATVVDTPNDRYLFAKNGYPEKKIFCHRNQGGYPSITDRGLVILRDLGTIEKPRRGVEIVLVRESSNPDSDDYTKAFGWTLKAYWDKVAWAVNATRTFRVVSMGHSMNGVLMKHNNKEVSIVEAPLIEIMRRCKSQPDLQKQLSAGYTTRVGNTTFSYETVIWYRHDPDGTWTEVCDPRPIVAE